MATHPINLILRFLLEITSLFAMGYWGYTQNEGMLKYTLAIGLPLALATIWGVFNVPKDPSRSGNAPVAVPGIVRLLIELGFFAFAVWAIYIASQTKYSIIFAGAIILHYASSYDRINWLLKN